jgi:hypothetical protein
MSVENIKREVMEGWEDVPAAALSLRIIDYMASLRDQELRMLTIPTLLRATDREDVSAEFLAAIAILVSSTVHVLEAKAFFCGDDDSEVHVDARELADARRLGNLEHPETGELIEDFEDRLIPYFESSSRFLEARANG